VQGVGQADAVFMQGALSECPFQIRSEPGEPYGGFLRDRLRPVERSFDQGVDLPLIRPALAQKRDRRDRIGQGAHR